MKKKVLVGLVTVVLMLSMMVSPVFAAILTYDTAATTTWGVNGGAGIDDYKIKLQDEGIAAEDAAKVTTISVTFDVQTDSFKPQIIANSEKGGWNQLAIELTTPGVNTYDWDITGKFTADSGWNEFWIQSGWKNEGAVSLLSVEFKDADGNVIYSVGTEEEGTVDVGSDDTDVVDTSDDAAVEDTAVEDTAAEDTAVEETADTADTAEAELPDTGVIGLGLLYGVGTLATGALALKKRNK
jgi:hypothetical protein